MIGAVAWIGLIASWLAVVLIVKLLIVSLRVLKNIRRLAEMSVAAATGLSANLAAAESFAEVDDLSPRLSDAGRALAAATAGVRGLAVSADDPGGPS